MGGTPLVARVGVRAVDVPARTPAELAGGTLTSAPVVLIDIEDGDGLRGRSYVRCYATEVLRASAVLVADLGALLVGAPATPEALGSVVPYPLRLLGTRGLVGCALAGLDMALWDLRSVRAGQPLARLLGGPAERAEPAQPAEPMDSVPVYVTIRSRLPATAARETHEAVTRGVRAVKVKIGGDLAAARALVRAVQEAAGAGVAVMADLNQSLDPAAALAGAAELDALGLSWLEEPVDHADLAGAARVRAALRTPVQLGENLEGADQVARAIAAGASDLLMFDAMKVGGVSGWLEAARVAGAAGLPLSSHAFPEISRHLLAASPNPGWLELVDHLAPIRTDDIELHDGRAVVPLVPGGDLTWDEAAVTRHEVLTRESR